MAIAASVAAPLLHEGPLDWVCTGSGQMKLVQLDGSDEAGRGAALDCPNCLLLGPPPACPVPALTHANTHSLPSLPRQRGDHARFDAGPPPARGPPENSNPT